MKIKNLILCIIVSLLLVACKDKQSNDIPLKQKDKGPESLQNLNTSLNEILDFTGQIEKINLDIDFSEEEKLEEKNRDDKDKDSSTEENNKDNEDINNKEKDNQDKEDNEKSDQEESTEKPNENNTKEPSKAEKDMKLNPDALKSEKLKNVWQKMDKYLEEVHFLWNSYEVEAMKKGGSSERSNQFEQSINKMTKAIENRSIIDIYDYGSQAILNLKPFWDLYTDDFGGDIAEIKYKVYQFYLKAIDNDKDGAIKVIANKEENINRIRLKIGEDEKKIKELDKVSYALNNLGNSLNEDSRRLYIIKKDNLIQSLKSLENS